VKALRYAEKHLHLTPTRNQNTDYVNDPLIIPLNLHHTIYPVQLVSPVGKYKKGSGTGNIMKLAIERENC
jgi:hypothetical protein